MASPDLAQIIRTWIRQHYAGVHNFEALANPCKVIMQIPKHPVRCLTLAINDQHFNTVLHNG